MKMMMYRRYTTIGMNNTSISVKEIVLAIVCFVIAVGIRIFFMISGNLTVTDDFLYYQASMIENTVKEPVITSGIAFAYTEALSDIFIFAGNRMDMVAVFHIVLQAAIFFFLFLGFYFLFGRAAAFLEIILFSFSPDMIFGIFKVSPESFYLFGWSLVLLLIAVFYKRTKENGWHRSSFEQVYLVLTGVLLGVICIWHCTGFLLVFVIAYSMVRNAALLREKRHAWREAHAMESLFEQKDSDDDKKEEIMPVIAQILILIMGMLLGGFCTLMRYTGVTGYYITEQVEWWLQQLFCAGNGRLQDLSLRLPLWIFLTLIMGAFVQMIIAFICKIKKDREPEEIVREKEEQNTDVKEVQKAQVEAMSEERKINYIENPLPLPKKHVKRTLDFKLDDKQDEFDVEINENDDFDI